MSTAAARPAGPAWPRSGRRRRCRPTGTAPGGGLEHAGLGRGGDDGGRRVDHRRDDHPAALPAAGRPEHQHRLLAAGVVGGGEARPNRRVGPSLVTAEVPGLAAALLRPPTVMTLHLRRLNGSVLDAHIRFPDEPSALGLKAFATTVRSKDTVGGHLRGGPLGYPKPHHQGGFTPVTRIQRSDSCQLTASEVGLLRELVG